MRHQAQAKRAAAVLSVAVGVAVMLPAAASAARGDLDRSFAGDGVAVTTFPSSGAGQTFAIAEGVVKQRHGRMVVAGWAGSYDSGSNDASNFAFARYRRNGELDHSFGDQGRQLVDIGNADEATDLARLPNGGIVAVGRSGAPLSDRSPNRRVSRSIAVAVLMPDGEPDPSFGDGGSTLVRLPQAGRPAAVDVVQRNGRIVIGGRMAGVGGRTAADFFVMRLRANGELDGTFAGDGMLRVDFDRPGLRFTDDYLTDLAIDSVGRIAVGGTAYQYNKRRPRLDPDFAIARLRPSGRLDHSFSRDGRRTLNVRRGQPAETERDRDEAAALVPHPSGALILVGEVLPEFTGTPVHPSVAVVRVDSKGRLEQRFAGDGTRITGLRGDARATDVVLRRDRKIVVSAEGNSAQVTALRYGRFGRLDPSFSGNGRAVFRITPRLSPASIARGPHQKVVVAGTTGLVETSRFYVARFSRHGAR